MGKKIFMQGGVCFNKAVPMAMASLIGKEIIVPPQPGLMGAFGAALEAKNKINNNLMAKKRFDLRELADREVQHKKSFACTGGSEKCDRKCSIAIIDVAGKNYPFGGACNRYYNLRFHVSVDAAQLNLVKIYQKLVFEEFGSYKPKMPVAGKKIGINKSFLVHSLFPLYSNFFTKLGVEVVLSESCEEAGLERQGSAFCYPAGIAHGFFSSLLKKDLDYIFLPHLVEFPVENAISRKQEHQCTCFILQAEPYYLRQAFKDVDSQAELLIPVLNFSQGYRSQEEEFAKIGTQMGFDVKQAKEAFRLACDAQDRFHKRAKQIGEEFVKKLEKDPELTAIVLFGRPYNAFTADANMQIPHKFATRTAAIIPFEFLPYEYGLYRGPKELLTDQMTWATGQKILKAADFVKEHPQLFGAYITNFSCGPDSFLLNYFRDIMKEKPSLTLEIDSHTADVGLDTRVEAFLEIIKRYRRLKSDNTQPTFDSSDGFNPASLEIGKKGITVVSSDKKRFSLTDPNVKLLLPSMGDLANQAVASVFNSAGVRTVALPVPDWEILRHGRANTSGKECLPFILVTGGLMKYLECDRKPGELLVYFMPTVSGNCRFAQYNVSVKNLIRKNRIRNLAVLSLTSENSYSGLDHKFMKNALKGVIVSDVMDDIRNALRVLAKNSRQAMDIFREEWNKITLVLKGKSKEKLERQLEKTALRFRIIPLKYPLSEAKVVSLLGEIFVRKEIFSRRQAVEKLIQNEIIPRVATGLEWLYYVDYLVKNKVLESNFDLRGKIEFVVRQQAQRHFEKKIKKILDRSGLYPYHLIDIEKLVCRGKDFVDIRLTGEPIIVIGAALEETLRTVHGVISIGPFACLPTRVTEAILSRQMNIDRNLPFLSIESDGNPFPQVVEAKLEAFCLQVKRTHLIREV